jgi:hypothetical protein
MMVRLSSSLDDNRGSGHTGTAKGAIRMATVVELGTFERVPIRTAWPTEDDNFTPWLAQHDSVKLLSEP